MQVKKPQTATFNYHVITIYVPTANVTLQMPHICQICQLLHVQIYDNYVSIYTSYHLTAMNNVTRITGIYTSSLLVYALNKYALLHIYVILDIYCSLLTDSSLLQTAINELHHLFTILLQNMCQQQISLSNAIHMSDVILLNMHQWENYANIYVTYELTGLNHVARSTVHRCQQWCRMMMMP